MTEAIIAGIALGFVLIFAIGPVIFTIIKLRINYGITSAFYFVAGVWLSDILWVITSNAFGSFLQDLVEYKMYIGAVGGVLLLSLGIYYLFFKKYYSKAELDNGVKIGNATHYRLFITGFLLNTLNPGVIALWFATATNTISYSVEEKILTYSICLGMTIFADFFKIHLAGKLRQKLNDRNIGIINKITGTLYMIFGIALIAGVAYVKLKYS